MVSWQDDPANEVFDSCEFSGLVLDQITLGSYFPSNYPYTGTQASVTAV